MRSLALFNAQSGMGTTRLVYHLAHMIGRMGARVLAVDLDPQCDLTTAFLDEDDLAELWDEPWFSARDRSRILEGYSDTGFNYGTMAQAVRPVMGGAGDVVTIDPVRVDDALWLLPGDLELGSFEDALSGEWRDAFSVGGSADVRRTVAVYQVITAAASTVEADIVLMDIGPNLGALTRVSLLAADAVVIPLKAELRSLRSLENLGPALGNWRRVWQKTVLPRVPDGTPAPHGAMHTLGYIAEQPMVRLDRSYQSYRWVLDRIPEVFPGAVLGDAMNHSGGYELAEMGHYPTLRSLARDVRKPMFDLRAADGAMGSVQTLVQHCYRDFRRLSAEILTRLNISYDAGWQGGR